RADGRASEVRSRRIVARMSASDMREHCSRGRFGLPGYRCYARLALLQPVRKIADGLAVDRRPVPLAHGFEVRGALAIGRAVLEARDVQKVCGGGVHIGHAVAKIDVAITVE